MNAATVPVLRLVKAPDGFLDIYPLEQTVSREAMRAWIRGRLMSKDEWWPLDAQSGEATGQIFIDLWKRTVTHGRIHQAIDQACYDLFPDAWITPPAFVFWARSFLQLIRAIQPPSYINLLKFIIQYAHFTKVQIEYHLDTLWLEVATAYELQSPELLSAWRVLLNTGHSRYGLIAYSVLSQDAELALGCLPEYHVLFPEDERELFIRDALKQIVQRQGLEFLLTRLRFYRTIWEQGEGSTLMSTVRRALERF